MINRISLTRRTLVVASLAVLVACNSNSPVTPAPKKSTKPTTTASESAATTGGATDTPSPSGSTGTTSPTTIPNKSTSPSATPTAKATAGATPTAKPTTAATGTPDATGTATASGPVTLAGSYKVATLAGLAGVAGHADGTASAASFSGPTSVCIDAAGVLYVADTNNDCIRKIVTTGGATTVSTYAGIAGNRGAINNANPLLATFAEPQSLTVSPTGDVYVADTGNNLIRKIAAGGGAVTTFAGAGGAGGYADGVGAAAKFSIPEGVTIAGGDLVVADSGNERIRKILLADATVSTLAGSATLGVSSGVGVNATFNGPTYVVGDPAGNVFVVDGKNSRIRKIDSGAAVSIYAGPSQSIQGDAGAGPAVDGGSSTARFLLLFGGGLGLAPDGTLYVGDFGNHRIRRVLATTGEVGTIAGDGKIVDVATVSGGFKDGSGEVAEFNRPGGIAVGADGALYVADYGNNAIRKITLKP